MICKAPHNIKNTIMSCVLREIADQVVESNELRCTESDIPCTVIVNEHGIAALPAVSCALYVMVLGVREVNLLPGGGP